MTMDKEQLQAMFSSKSGEWATPQEFFNKLNWRFGPFDLDPCATPSTAKCANSILKWKMDSTKNGKIIVLLLTLLMVERLPSG